MIDTREVAARILRGEVPVGATAATLVQPNRPVLLHADDTLSGAMLAFARAGVDVLPVVDADRVIRGLIDRNDLLVHYSRHVLEQRGGEVEIAGVGVQPGQEVGLGLGVVLERVVVQRSWAGRSLAELDLRGQFDVHVLEWRRSEEVLRLDPKVPLREGDVLAVAGTRDSLLALRWA
jgi:CBS domain-containing protein